MTSVDLRPVEDQVIVITGASSGIGLKTARMAADRGARLVLAARSEDALAELTDEINEAGGDAVYVVADVSEEDDVREIADVALDTYGGFDTWVNCAAQFLYGTLEETPVEDMREQFDTNVWGVVHGSLEALDPLRDEGGAIVNVGSVASDRAMPLQGSYSASKHAVKAFTDALRMEIEKEGSPISVTLIKPAAVDTPYPQHAKNYMDKEADLPPPVYAPETVARAVLHAAEHPERDIVVGGGGRALVGLERLASRLVDVFMEAVYFRQQRGDRIPVGEENVIDEPVGDLEERGGYEGRVRERSLYTSARRNRSVLGASIVGAIGAAVAYLRYRARRADRGLELEAVEVSEAERRPRRSLFGERGERGAGERAERSRGRSGPRVARAARAITGLLRTLR